jgi:hypothetical protein
VRRQCKVLDVIYYEEREIFSKYQGNDKNIKREIPELIPKILPLFKESIVHLPFLGGNLQHNKYLLQYFLKTIFLIPPTLIYTNSIF